MNILKVTIEGSPMAGTSVLAYAIKDLCEKNNVTVELIGETEELPSAMEKSWPARLAKLSDRSRVIVETKQVRRGELVE